MHPELRRWARHPFGGPPEISERPGFAFGGRGPALPGWLLSPVPERGRLAAGNLSGERFSHSAARARGGCWWQPADGECRLSGNTREGKDLESAGPTHSAFSAAYQRRGKLSRRPQDYRCSVSLKSEAGEPAR